MRVLIEHISDMTVQSVSPDHFGSGHIFHVDMDAFFASVEVLEDLRWLESQ